jgi:hypothetical protein
LAESPRIFRSGLNAVHALSQRTVSPLLKELLSTECLGVEPTKVWVILAEDLGVMERNQFAESRHDWNKVVRTPFRVIPCDLSCNGGKSTENANRRNRIVLDKTFRRLGRLIGCIQLLSEVGFEHAFAQVFRLPAKTGVIL